MSSALAVECVTVEQEEVDEAVKEAIENPSEKKTVKVIPIQACEPWHNCCPSSGWK